MKGSTGSFNAGWRRELGGGDTDQPEATPSGDLHESAVGEKLNDEPGIKPLPVNNSRDGAELVQKIESGRVREQLLYSGP